MIGEMNPTEEVHAGGESFDKNFVGMQGEFKFLKQERIDDG